MFRNILVSVDGSTSSERALAEAIDIANSSRARLTILTAVSTPPAWAYAPSSVAAIQALAPDLERESKEILAAAVATVPDSVPVTSILSTRPVRKALARELTGGRYDLLVMGSRGRGAFAASLLGSVSQFALNHSQIPVLIVHADDAARPRSAPRTRTMEVWPTQSLSSSSAASSSIAPS
jgi:nucleotide-binding universal stress UspA family protein